MLANTLQEQSNNITGKICKLMRNMIFNNYLVTVSQDNDR